MYRNKINRLSLYDYDFGLKFLNVIYARIRNSKMNPIMTSTEPQTGRDVISRSSRYCKPETLDVAFKQYFGNCVLVGGLHLKM